MQEESELKQILDKQENILEAKQEIKTKMDENQEENMDAHESHDDYLTGLAVNSQVTPPCLRVSLPDHLGMPMFTVFIFSADFVTESEELLATGAQKWAVIFIQ